GRAVTEPAPGAELQAPAHFYLDKALNPRGTGDGEFSVNVVNQGNITVADLPHKGVVVWTEPSPPDKRRFGLVKRFLQRGGAMMVWLRPDRKGAWRDEAFAAYLGIQRGVVKEKAEGERMGSFAKGHPVFSIFNEEELELLSRSRVNRYVAVTGVSPDSVLAYFDSGAPAVWECTRGQGRLLVVSAAADLSSGNLPLSPMFLPFVHTAVSYLASSEQLTTKQENIVGEDLYFDLPAKWTAQTGDLRILTNSGGETRPALYEAGRGEIKALLTAPRAVGFYTLLADTTRIGEACVNVDTRESNLNARDLESADLDGARVVETSGDVAENLRRETQGREVYAVFLLLALSALVAEALLGRKA
ncbi:MAG: hypothetical protein P8181_14795, partial [bacterium]